jgi:hypothetical protein
MMANKHKVGDKKKASEKRVAVEIAPAVRVMLDDYIKTYNEGPGRVSSPLKYTNVINQALDEFLPGQTQSNKDDNCDEGAKISEGKGDGS